MRVVLQRVKQASVSIGQKEHASITQGLLLLVGIADSDTLEVVEKLAKKCVELRIFEDAEGKMNLSLNDVKGSVLSVSQFTLYADCKKGRRPSFTKSAKPEYAIQMYEAFNEQLRQLGVDVECGVFGADMQVSLCNDGPVTIILDSEEI